MEVRQAWILWLIMLGLVISVSLLGAMLATYAAP
jgi:hypothetical protein